jgi:hypothetical protein
MEQVSRILADYQWWIYVVLGILLLFYLRRALLARRESARSIFKLEQETCDLRYRRSALLSILIVLAMGAVFTTSRMTLSPPVAYEPTEEPTLTVTAGPLVAPTLTPTPPPATMTPTATATPVRPTVPATALATDTPESLATPTPAVRPPACPNPNARITSPGVNQALTGSVAVRGVANTEDLQYYKIEIGPGSNPRDHEWAVVGQLHYTPAEGGLLETLHTGAYPPGVYTIRLVVVDRTGNYPEPCRVTVSIQR